MRRTHIAATVAAVLIGGAVVAAFDDNTIRNTTGGDAATERVARAGAGGGTLADTDLFAADEAAAPAPAPAAEAASRVPDAPSRVVKTATIEVSVRDNDLVTKATQEANRIAESLGGFVATTDSFQGEGRQTTLSLRVPVDRYDAALTELRQLGKVESEKLGGKDVTSTLTDLDARLRTLRAQEEALNALIAKARTVGETLEVAREAANVRMQIEQLAAQQAQLSDQADFATISLHIVGPNVTSLKTQPASEPLLVKSFERALGGTLAVFGGAIVLLGYLLPAALLAGVGYGVWRLVRGRRPQGAAVAS